MEAARHGVDRQHTAPCARAFAPFFSRCASCWRPSPRRHCTRLGQICSRVKCMRSRPLEVVETTLFSVHSGYWNVLRPVPMERQRAPLTDFQERGAMLIEVSIEYRGQKIFSGIFDTHSSVTFKEFRRDFNSRFSLKHPTLLLDDPHMRETWREIQVSHRQRQSYVGV